MKERNVMRRRNRTQEDEVQFCYRLQNANLY